MIADAAQRIERILAQRLERGRKAGVFPGASASVAIWTSRAWTYIDQTAGALIAGGSEVTRDTIYDLASLTKPWVATAALHMHHRGTFSLDAPVHGLIPEARGLAVGDRTWEAVLSHRAGLRAWVPFYEALPEAPGSTASLRWIVAELLEHGDANPEGTAVYSDLGYILAGVAMSRAAATGLDEESWLPRSADRSGSRILFSLAPPVQTTRGKHVAGPPAARHGAVAICRVRFTTTIALRSAALRGMQECSGPRAASRASARRASAPGMEDEAPRKKRSSGTPRRPAPAARTGSGGTEKPRETAPPGCESTLRRSDI